jgi:ABC-type uncharacterized transport system permease subunit
MSSQSGNTISWKVGLTLTVIGLALMVFGSLMLQSGAVHNDVLTIVRGGLIFISGICAVIIFGIFMHWDYRK